MKNIFKQMLLTLSVVFLRKGQLLRVCRKPASLAQRSTARYILGYSSNMPISFFILKVGGTPVK